MAQGLSMRGIVRETKKMLALRSLNTLVILHHLATSVLLLDSRERKQNHEHKKTQQIASLQRAFEQPEERHVEINHEITE
jgi:hypothetical protein